MRRRLARRHRVRRQRLLRLAGAEPRPERPSRARGRAEPCGGCAGGIDLRRPHRCRRTCARTGGPFRHRGGTRRARLAPGHQQLSAPRHQPALGARRCPTTSTPATAPCARTYRYLILNRTARSALAAGRALLVHQPLDVEADARGAGCLIGEHDFSAFRSSECQARSPVRQLRRARDRAPRRLGP